MNERSGVPVTEPPSTAAPRGKPFLRADIRLTRTGPDSFLLSDPRTGQLYALGEEEVFLIRQLEQRPPMDQVRKAYRQRFKGELTERRLAEFCEQLSGLGVLADAPSHTATSRAGVIEEAPGAAEEAQNELVKTKGVFLNAVLDFLAISFGWLLHPAWLVLYGTIIVLGSLALISHFDLLVTELREIPVLYLEYVVLFFSVSQTIVFMNLPRELAVGTACRLHGGRVIRMRLFWLLGVLPFFFCDVGSSLAFMMSRKDTRGVWTVLLVGPVMLAVFGTSGALFWRMSDEGSIIRLFWVLLIPVCIISVLLNSVIFMRLDAYKILCYLFKDPLIYERARAETWAWLTRRTSPEALTDRERYWLRLYGLGMYLWDVLGHLVLLIVLEYWLIQRFKGVGALASVLLYAWWQRQWLWRLCMSFSVFQWLANARRNPRTKWAIRGGYLLIVLLLGCWPYRFEVKGDCSVVPNEEYGARAQIADEIVKVHVREGQWVQSGDPLITFSGREAQSNYHITLAELEHARADLDLLKAGSLEEEIRMAEQRLEMKEIDLDFYTKELERTEELYKVQASTVRELDTARQKRDLAVQSVLSARDILQRTKDGAREEEIRGAQAEVDRLRTKLDYYDQQRQLLDVKTPIAGRVTTSDVEDKLNQVPDKGDLLVVVQDDSKLFVEVAADESAGDTVQEGARVKVRLNSQYGRLLWGTVRAVSYATSSDAEFSISPIRTDREAHMEQSVDTKEKENYHLRVYVELDEESRKGLVPGMTGYARIIVDRGVLWSAIFRPFIWFFRTEVWSWMPQ
jgi:multidrug resistance efflux pump